eukprot:m.106104 g.106104  ORF g.106104 m.106104 type:complete len:295 (-) comp15756_c0_seq2:131-1015(-)
MAESNKRARVSIAEDTVVHPFDQLLAAASPDVQVNDSSARSNGSSPKDGGDDSELMDESEEAPVPRRRSAGIDNHLLKRPSFGDILQTLKGADGQLPNASRLPPALQSMLELAVQQQRSEEAAAAMVSAAAAVTPTTTTTTASPTAASATTPVVSPLAAAVSQPEILNQQLAMGNLASMHPLRRSVVASPSSAGQSPSSEGVAVTPSNDTTPRHSTPHLSQQQRRSSSNRSLGSDMETEEQKKVMRLEKNRIAAKECRRKRKEYVQSLEDRVRLLTEENDRLKRQLMQATGSNT